MAISSTLFLDDEDSRAVSIWTESYSPSLLIITGAIALIGFTLSSAEYIGINGFISDITISLLHDLKSCPTISLLVSGRR